jgi:hypothetical protein
MQRASRLSNRAKGAVLAALAAGCAVAAGVVSCVTASPADVPTPPMLGPIIVQDSVWPSASAYLTVLPVLPSEFAVPVRVFDPTRPITCRVFVDFVPGSSNNTAPASTCPNTLPALDGGLTVLTFPIFATNFPDPTSCHTIQCFVADVFDDPTSSHTPAPTFEADSVTWQYTPNGPGNCDEFDGDDGAFPSADAPMDGLLLTPPDGGI